MKPYFVTTLFTILIILSSCKNDTKEIPAKTVDTFKITFDLISKIPDTLDFFYTNDTVWNFNDEKHLRQPIVGDSLQQLVSFEIPDGTVPTFFRLDFNNKNQDTIFLNHFTATYKDKILVDQDSLMTNYFSPHNVEINNSKKAIIILKNNEDFDPFIFSTVYLKEKLQYFNN